MGTSSQLRQRRSEAELYAALQVERQVRAVDPHSEHEYIRVFSEAFRTYRSRLSRSGLLDELLRADVLLVADYHALPASQHYTANLLDQLSAPAHGRLPWPWKPSTARNQHILNAWRNGRIDERTAAQRHSLRCRLGLRLGAVSLRAYLGPPAGSSSLRH